MGGFDVVLGNPPWERIKLQEKEWFAAQGRIDIANAPNAAARKRLIEALKTEDPPLWQAFQEAKREAEGTSHLVRHSDRYPLCGRGDVNTYTVFAELMRTVTGPVGRTGCIVPSGIATDDTTKYFFQDLMDQRSLASLYDFENREKIFPAVDSRMKFCLLTLAGLGRPNEAGAEFIFFAHNTGDLRDPERRFTLAAEDIALLNPNTRTCPIFRTRRDAEITKGVYSHMPILGKATVASENEWSLAIPQGTFHQTNDAHLLHSQRDLSNRRAIEQPDGGWLVSSKAYRRVFEGRLIWLYDHRAASSGISEENVARSGVTIEIDEASKCNVNVLAKPRYWAESTICEERIPATYSDGYVLVFKDVTSATNARTMIAAFIPRVGILYSLRALFFAGHTPVEKMCFGANLNAFVFDFLCRLKTPGNHITDYIIRQLPVLRPGIYARSCPWHPELTAGSWIAERVRRLSCTAIDMEPMLQEVDGLAEIEKWEPIERATMRSELDAAFFHLYGITREDVDYIMEAFPIVKRKDIKEHGEYRTKLRILEFYDEMAQTMKKHESQAGHSEASAEQEKSAKPSLTPYQAFCQRKRLEGHSFEEISAMWKARNE